MKKTQPALDASSCDYDGPKYSADQKQFARKAEGVKTKDSLSEWRLSYYYKTLETMTPPAKKDTNQNWQKPETFPLPRDKWGHPNPPPEQAKIPAIINPRSNTLIITRRVQHTASYNDDRNANAKGGGGGRGKNTERNRINALIQQ